MIHLQGEGTLSLELNENQNLAFGGFSAIFKILISQLGS